MSKKRSDSQVAQILERLKKEVMREKTGDPPADDAGPIDDEASDAPNAVDLSDIKDLADGQELLRLGADKETPAGSAEAKPSYERGPPTARPQKQSPATREEAPSYERDPPTVRPQKPTVRPQKQSPTTHQEEVPSYDSSPSTVRTSRRRGSPGLHSKRVQAADRPASSTAVKELMKHRRQRQGKLFGIAGLPRHGKTKLADRLRERAADRPGADLRYNKTERGDVNIYYLPGKRDHHVLVDMAGEDYQVLGDYDRELPELMEAFLWPVLKRLDGLALLMALPVVWSGWNRGDERRRRAPSADEQEEIAAAAERMVNAHKMLLKYAVVARFDRKLRRKGRLNSKPGRPPTRDQVDDAFQRAPKYDRPVAVVLSKADLYTGRVRDRLHTPDLPRMGHRTPAGVRPGESEPLLTAAAHFPDFLEFLERGVRCFKWSFCQALEDRSPEPDPLDAAVDAETGTNTLIGGDGVVDFLARHPWRAPGLSSAMAIRLDRRLRPEAWSRLGQEPRPARKPVGHEA